MSHLYRKYERKFILLEPFLFALFKVGQVLAVTLTEPNSLLQTRAGQFHRRCECSLYWYCEAVPRPLARRAGKDRVRTSATAAFFDGVLPRCLDPRPS